MGQEEDVLIYFDNAATTMDKPRRVVEAVGEALTSFGGVGRGVHEASIKAGMAVFEARDAVARLLGVASSERVAFAANATAALNMAVAGLVPAGGVALTTAASHNSVLRPLFKARDERGVEVRVVGHDRRGVLDEEALLGMLDGVDVVAITHASNLTGDVYDVAAIARAAHEAGALVVLDAAQTAGTVPFTMADVGADVVCFTGHKGLLGPQGTGGLAVAEGVELPPLLEGGSGTMSFMERHPRFMPEALEAGTPNAHGLAGLAAGVDYVMERGVEAIHEHEVALANRLAAGLGDVAGVTVHGGAEHARCGIVAFNVGEVDSGVVADRLASEWGICTRAGAHCAPLMHKALGTERQGAVRASFGPFNVEDEVDACLEAIRVIAREELA